MTLILYFCDSFLKVLFKNVLVDDMVARMPPSLPEAQSAVFLEMSH